MNELQDRIDAALESLRRAKRALVDNLIVAHSPALTDAVNEIEECEAILKHGIPEEVGA